MMFYSIADFAEKMGVTPYTLRYYEKEQLIVPSRQTNGHRYYSEHDITWLSFVIKLKETGMPIKQIQQYALLRAKGDSTLEERRKMLLIHRQQVQAELNKWQENLTNLDNKLEYYQQAINNSVHPNT